MQWISESNILIIGLGLMGGSYAKGFKRLGYKVSAIDKDKETIDYALSEGIIDYGDVTADKDMISNADVLIFALYPGVLKKWILDYQKYFKPGLLITDVTGVKESVVYFIQDNLRDDVEFIASHPMAGKETSGIKMSDCKMFYDANFIVTPTEKNTKEAIEWCKGMGKILGFSKISVLSPKEHDKIIGFVSQLTHIIAVSLMTCNDNTHLCDYTGDSFRDLTRIANINDEMWSELFLLNKDVLLEQTDNFISEISEIRNMLYEGNKEGLREKMTLSTQRRKYFNK